LLPNTACKTRQDSPQRAVQNLPEQIGRDCVKYICDEETDFIEGDLVGRDPWEPSHGARTGVWKLPVLVEMVQQLLLFNIPGKQRKGCLIGMLKKLMIQNHWA